MASLTAKGFIIHSQENVPNLSDLVEIISSEIVKHIQTTGIVNTNVTFATPVTLSPGVWPGIGIGSIT